MKIFKKQILIIATFFLIIVVLSTITPNALADSHEEGGTTIYDRTKQGADSTIKEAFGPNIDPGVSAVEGAEKDPFLYFLFGVINQLLNLVAILFFLLLIYAGYLWMNARGKEEQVEKAKKITREALIGIIIIFLAKIITQFILTQIGEAVYV